jgi:hypothetical protein
MVLNPRLIPAAFRLASLALCLVKLATGATLPSAPVTDARTGLDSRIESSAPESAMFVYKWNVDEKQAPLLELPDHLRDGLDQFLAYPIGEVSFPIFQTLSYDEQQSKYLLPLVPKAGADARFIEFIRDGDGRNYSSNDGTKMQLVDQDSLKTIRTADGTKYIFVRHPDGEFKCAGIKDSQGSYLSFIYAANGVTLHSVGDSSGRTITFNYGNSGIRSVTQTWMANLEGLTKTWSVGDSSNQERSNHYSTSATSLMIKVAPSNAILREYTSAMAESDKLLAKVFGGPGAVAAGNGFEPAGLAAGYPFYRGDITGDDGRVRRGHLSYAMHLYGSANGSGESPLYVPTGFTSHSAQPSPTDGVVTFYYPRLGSLSDVTLAVFHVADFQLTNEGDRVRIGNIGGPGGSSALYRHSHIEFYRGNTGLPPLSARSGLRIDPSSVFAPETASSQSASNLSKR